METNTSRFRSVSICVYLSLLFIAIYFSFAYNSLGVVKDTRFRKYQRDTEAHVIGRIVQSRNAGFWSYGSLTGVGLEKELKVGEYRPWPRRKAINAQYEAFNESGEFPHYSPYLSQNGGQAMLFTLLDRVLPFSPKTRFSLFQGITSFMAAGVLVGIVLWIYLELGFAASLFTSLSILASEWMTVFGKNLWWSLWAFFLPMLLVAFALRKQSGSDRADLRCAKWIFIGLSCKFFFNGYEYITTTLVMTAVPFVYYLVVYRPESRLVLKAIVFNIAAGLLALVLSLGFLCVQIGMLKEGFRSGVDHIVYSFGKRTHGKPENFPSVYRRSLKADGQKVYEMYLDGTYLMTREKGENLARVIALVDEVWTYRRLDGWFFKASLFLVLVLIFQSASQRMKSLAFLVAFYVSFLAPYSWYIIFKGHSQIHYQMNQIVWHMPYVLLGFALMGYVLQEVLSFLIKPWGSFRKKTMEPVS